VKAATLDLDREERIRRFWKAHARSYAHLTLLHAFCNNPEIAWTPEHLSDWYGLRIDRTRVVARELAACGILRPAGGRGRGVPVEPGPGLGRSREPGGPGLPQSGLDDQGRRDRRPQGIGANVKEGTYGIAVAVDVEFDVAEKKVRAALTAEG